MNFRIPVSFVLSVDTGVGANPVQVPLLLKLVVETWKASGIVDVLSHGVDSEPVP